MSWFNRKPRNRKAGTVSVLDVRLRSTQLRAKRTKFAALGLTMVFGTLFGFFLLWRAGEWALDRLIYSNKAFAIQDIELRTDGVIALEQLKRWAGVKPGENLLALDLSRIKRNLEMVSMVKSVAVERILPRTLHIRVMERQPLAVVSAPAAPAGAAAPVAWRLDEQGFVMVPLDPRQRTTAAGPGENSLPAISGINPAEVIAGHALTSPEALCALKLVAAFDHSPMAGLVDLRQIDISSPEILVAKTGDGGEITFATEDLDQQLRRWRAIHDWAHRLGKTVISLDLSVPNHIPAHCVDAAAPAAKPQNPQPDRKKNV